MCFCGFFFLPDNFGPGARVLGVVKQFQRAGPEMFIPAPPIARPKHHDVEDGAGGASDIHLRDDRARLAEKIKSELGEILEKPEIMPNEVNAESLIDSGGGGAGGGNGGGGAGESDDGGGVVDQPLNNNINNGVAAPPPPNHSADEKKLYPIRQRTDPDSSVMMKRNKVKEVRGRTVDYYSYSRDNWALVESYRQPPTHVYLSEMMFRDWK